MLEELGIKLYSNVPAVLSEAVANAWDADATYVNIEINTETNEIIITDNGVGMLVNDTTNEVNHKYLNVGYHKREDIQNHDKDHDGNVVTSQFKRPIMGRKGIGKLSLFAIADEFHVHTVKNGYKAGFIMSSDDIKEQIDADNTIYEPQEIPASEITIDKGTKIILKRPKKNLHQINKWLKRRLARRFGIQSEEYNFQISLNGEPVKATHREYFDKAQYLWEYGESTPSFRSLCTNLSQDAELHDGIIDKDRNFTIRGWIAASQSAGQLKSQSEQDNINKIALFVREKVAQEDILEEYGEDGLYASYVFGEIYADFLDMDTPGWVDIATSSRQRIIEDDERYITLKKFIHEKLKIIQNKWTERRTNEGLRRALDIPAVKKWYNNLTKDHQNKIRSLFGKINTLIALTDDQRKVLIQQSVIAFEILRHKQELDKLNNMTADDINSISKVFNNLDDFESALYYQIVTERLNVINALIIAVEQKQSERSLQEHLFQNLWLLDPSWERATEIPTYMESTVSKMFKDIDSKLTPKERLARIDIKYTTAQGKHVIVELKKSNVRVSVDDIIPQMRKYKNALETVVKQHENQDGPVECICIIGERMIGWDNPDRQKADEGMLAVISTRVVTYEQLIRNAQRNYQDFLVRKEQAGQLTHLISAIKNHNWEADDIPQITPTTSENTPHQLALALNPNRNHPNF